MIKTNIKMRVTPEQSKKVQEICFENGIYWRNELIDHILYTERPYLFVLENLEAANKSYDFENDYLEEIDADFFIKTNGTCGETYKTEYLAKYVNHTNKDSMPKDYDDALKKISNLRIALNKKIDKNKNQALEITKLLEQKKDLQEEIKRMLKHEQTLIDDLYKSQCKESDKFEEIKKLNTIISYLESKLK